MAIGEEAVVSLTDEQLRRLEEIAKRLRRHIVTMIGYGTPGHLGGSCSVADIVAVLYFHKMRLQPGNPNWPQRDRFLLSKSPCGHRTLAGRRAGLCHQSGARSGAAHHSRARADSARRAGVELALCTSPVVGPLLEQCTHDGALHVDATAESAEIADSTSSIRDHFGEGGPRFLAGDGSVFQNSVL